MSYEIIHGERAADWFFQRESSSADYFGSHSSIASVRGGEIVASTLFHMYSGKNVYMHVTTDGGKRWCTRRYLQEVFSYVFDTLGCIRCTGLVSVENKAAQRLDEGLGFVREGLMECAGARGEDVIIYRMYRRDCRYVR